MNLTYVRIFISIRQTKFVGTFVSIGYLYPTTLLKTSTLFLLNKYSEIKCYNQLDCNVMTNLAVTTRPIAAIVITAVTTKLDESAYF